MLKKITILISVLLGIPLLTIIFFNGTILSTNSPPILKSIVLLFNPPKDLYTPLVDEELDVTGKKRKYIFSFSHTYTGKYNIGIYLDNFDSGLYFNSSKFELASNIDCYVNKELRYSDSVTGGSPYIGKSGGGYILFTYNVPTKFFTDELVKCVLAISNVDKNILKEQGIARIRVMKTSDL